MDFKSDLIHIIKHYLSTGGISYEGNAEASDLTARYYEMQIRRIVPKRREVHFSNELNDSLGKLIHKSPAEQREKAKAAWGAVFRLRCLFAKGESVTPYLSKGVNCSTSKDGLLWDYGMHHFHLSRKRDKSGFIERSYYLLFAIIANEDVFFVDVRKHHDPEDLQWVRQDLLGIVHANWPELTDLRLLQGVTANTVTDEEKKELRRKNVNLITNVGGHAIAPLGMGTTFDGGSAFCRVWGSKLLHEVGRHEAYFYSQPLELRAQLKAKGVDAPGEMEFQLVLLDSLNPSAEMIESLQEDHCLSRDLCRMGFAIVEVTTRSPIVVSLKDEP